MRMLMALAVVTALAGCDDKKDAAVVAPSPTPTVVPAASGASVAPSGAAVAPSGAALAPPGATLAPSGAEVAPSGTSASGEAAKPETHKGDKNAKPGAATKAAPQPSGAMPHGNPEDGTLHYNPPPAQSPPAKKDTTH